MAERFFGNMTDEEYEEWKSLSKEERKAMARELAVEKRKAKKIKEAEDAAYWKNYRKEAQVEKGTDKFRLFPELLSQQPVFNEDYSLETSPEGLAAKALADEKLKVTEIYPLQLTDYRGQKGTSRGLSSLPNVTEDDNDSGFFSMKTLRDWGLTKDLNEELKKDAHKNRVITEEDHAKARALRADRLRASEFPEVVEDPRVVAPVNQLLADRQKYDLEKSGNVLLEQAEADRVQADEFADAQETTFDDEGNVLTLSPEDAEYEAFRKGIAGNTAMVAEENAREEELAIIDEYEEKYGEKDKGLDFYDQLKLSTAAFIKSKLDANVFMGDKTKDEIINTLVPAIDVSKKDKKKKKVTSLINLDKKKVEKNIEENTKKELKKIIKKEKVIEELSPTHVPPKKEMDIGGETSDPWMQQSDDFKLEYDPTFLAPKILDYQAAKTDTEREEVLKDTGKDERAAIREEADPKCFWVDPFTGFAINNCELDKRIRRKEEIELAKIFPPADRAVYLARKNVITQGDLTAMLDPTEMEQLDLLIKKQKAQEGAYTLISAKLKSEENPKRKEWLKMYINAGSNDNYGLQVLLGTKLGFSKDIMDAAQKSHLLSEKAKLDSKTGGKKAFENAFMVPYSTVVANEMKWIDRATAIVQKDGIMSEYQMDGVTIRDRSGRFRSYGLKEHGDMKTKSPEEQLAIYRRSPYYKRMIKNKNFLDADGNFDPTRLTKDKDSYERYLLDTLVWMAMEDLYNEKYTDMMRFVEENSFTSQRAKASMEKKFTATKQE